MILSMLYTELEALFLFGFFRATVVLSITVCFVAVVLWATRTGSPPACRCVWGMSLACGIALFPLTIHAPAKSVDERARVTIVRNPVETQLPMAETDNLSATEHEVARVSEHEFASSEVIAPKHMPMPTTETSKLGVVDWANWKTTLYRVLFAAWLLGLLLIVTQKLLQYRTVLLHIAKSSPAPDAWQRQWDRAVGQLSGFSSRRHRTGKRKIPMLVCDKIGPALVLTFTGYRLIVPKETWKSMTERQRRCVLLHESAHLRRGDVFWSLLARVIATIHWFNPLSWYAADQFEAAGECCCDDIASSGNRRLDFAEALLLVAASSREPLMVSVGDPPLSSRIRRVVESDCTRPRPLRGILVTTIVFALIGVLNVRVDAAPQPPAENASSGENSFVSTRKVEKFGDARFSLANEPNAFVLSPDSNYIAVNYQSASPPIRILSTKSGREIRGFEGEDGWAQRMIFTPDSKKLIALINVHLAVWDVASGKELSRTRLGKRGLANALAVSPNGETVAVGFDKRKALLLELADLEKGIAEKTARSIEVLRNDAETAALDPFEAPAKARKGNAGMDPFGGAAQSVEERDNLMFTSDGENLIWAVGGIYGSIWTFDVRSGKRMRTVRFNAPDDHPLPQDVDYAFLVDDDSVLIGGHRKQRINSQLTRFDNIDVLALQQWNTRSGKLEHDFTFGDKAFDGVRQMRRPKPNSDLFKLAQRIALCCRPLESSRYF